MNRGFRHLLQCSSVARFTSWGRGQKRNRDKGNAPSLMMSISNSLPLTQGPIPFGLLPPISLLRLCHTDSRCSSPDEGPRWRILAAVTVSLTSQFLWRERHLISFMKDLTANGFQVNIFHLDLSTEMNVKWQSSMCHTGYHQHEASMIAGTKAKTGNQIWVLNFIRYIELNLRDV